MKIANKAPNGLYLKFLGDSGVIKAEADVIDEQEIFTIHPCSELSQFALQSLKENKEDLSSIENQLLKHQLKEARDKLSSSENELEEAKIDSERKSICMLETFENSYCDDAAVIQAEKVRLELELEKSKSEIEELRLLHHDNLSAMRAEKEALENEVEKSKNEIMTLGLKFNDHLAITTEKTKEKQAELSWRNEECVSLTADCLNFQAARECLNTSTEMFKHSLAA
jgi:Xaa-Pro aminopeptidase